MKAARIFFYRIKSTPLLNKTVSVKFNLLVLKIPNARGSVPECVKMMCDLCFLTGKFSFLS